MERLLTQLERRFGRYAPSNVTWYLVGLSGFGYILLYMKPELGPTLVFDREAILAGEVWRLFTFLFLPWNLGGGVLGPIWTLFGLMFLYTVGTSLEAQWGSFRFDLYYLLGVLGTLAASFFFGGITNAYLNLGLILAFATEFPDYEIMLMLILPVKMKWLGLFDGALLLYSLATGSMNARAGIMVAMLNYFLFCGGPLVDKLRGGVAQASRKRERATSPFGPPERRSRVCAACGKSNTDDPALEFRVCDCAEKCHGKLTEYCLEHARNH